MDPEALKREAAEAAAEEIRDGMLLGLGTGSTVARLLDVLGARVLKGLRVRGVPTSSRTEEHARRLGIPLATLDEFPSLDLCIDGADEVTPELDCLKGLGGACVREKVVAAASSRFILIVDESKQVDRLGVKAPVVVEAIPFAAPVVLLALQDLAPSVRMAEPGRPYLTDNGNFLLELRTGPIRDPQTLARRLDAIPGVLDHGLFLGMAATAFVASAGGVRRLDR